MRAAAGIEAALGRVSLRMASSLELNEVLGEITRRLVRDLEAAMARMLRLQRTRLPKIRQLTRIRQGEAHDRPKIQRSGHGTVGALVEACAIVAVIAATGSEMPRSKRSPSSQPGAGSC